MNKLISQEILEHGILSTEENNRLAILAQQGDDEAKDMVVLNNLRLVVQQVSRYKRKEEDTDDLFQDGVCGLLRAITTYDETKSSFTTHAVFWIRAMILKSFRDMEEFHYEPTFYNKYIRYEKLKAAIGQEDYNFSENELRDYNLTQKDVDQIEKFMRNSTSLDALAERHDDEYNTSNDKIFKPEDNVENKVFEKEVKKIVSQEMERILNKNELFVIRNTYGIDADDSNKMTVVAEMLSKESGGKPYSRQRIQQIRSSAEKKLRKSQALKSLFLP